jgi:hypothetical protein
VRGQSQGDRQAQTQPGRAPLRRRATYGTSGERKGRLDAWAKGKGGDSRPHGIKGKGNWTMLSIPQYFVLYK